MNERRTGAALAGVLAVGLAVPALAQQQPAAAPRVPLQGPVMPWPAPIPARTHPDSRDELFVMVLGDVKTPLADATYDPAADRLTPREGAPIENYFKEKLGVPHYRPIDKSAFPYPPSGWCSWYFYYQEVTGAEVMANARWLAENLRVYGARYVQIDDGWQGTGHGEGSNRDWTTIDGRFEDMGELAAEIRKLGMLPGLWLAPHGQSNEPLARETGAFLLTPEGKSASSTWEGTFLVDPTKPQGKEYLSALFKRLKGWGYEYFKIDGQPIVIDEYRGRQEFMEGKRPEGVSAEQWADTLYRGTLETIREAIGERSYLLGCWGIPLQGAGIMNGSRTAGDVVPGWSGFLEAADAVQRWNWLHNIAWYCDPDTLLVRQPLEEGEARCWATIQGLTGQALLDSDRLPDLPASRVELLRRVFPAVDIRPLDLFKPERMRKPVWDLKVSHLGRAYDVVGVFNFDSARPEARLISWSELGLDPARKHHVFDFWRGEYLGCFENGVFATVPPRDVRVLTVMPAEDGPVLLSTSRHITQGWVDLLDVQKLGDPKAPVFRGRSRVIAGDPYVITVAMPPGAKTFAAAGASVIGERVPAGQAAPAPVNVRLEPHSGWATVTFTTTQSQEVNWQIDFESADLYHYPVKDPPKPSVQPLGLTGAEVIWGSGYHGAGAYEVLLDGKVLGAAEGMRATLRGLAPAAEHEIAVRGLWWDGAASEGKNGVKFTLSPREQMYLSEMEPARSHQGWGSLGRDRSADGRSLSVGGRAFEHGLGTHADSTIAYELEGVYTRLEGSVGIDDEATPPAPVEAKFEVWGDGKKLWDSGTLKSGGPAKAFSVEIPDVRTLELRTRRAGRSIDYLHTDWLEVRVSGVKKPPPPPPPAPQPAPKSR